MCLLGENGFVCDSDGSVIVGLDQELCLGPAPFNEGLAQGDHSLDGNEKGGQSGLGSGGHDEFDYFRNGEDWTVEGRGW